MRNVRIGLRTKDEPDTSAASRVRTRTRRQQTALNRWCCTVDDAAKRSAERKLTNEARTEGKLACPLPCKEEEDEVNDRSSRLYWVSARTVRLTRHSPADKSVIRSGRRRSGTAHRQRGSRAGIFPQVMITGLWNLGHLCTNNLRSNFYSYYYFLEHLAAKTGCFLWMIVR